MRKVKYNDTYIYIDDKEFDEKRSGIFKLPIEKLEQTQELNKINKEKILEKTLVDLWGNKNEQID